MIFTELNTICVCSVKFVALKNIKMKKRTFSILLTCLAILIVTVSCRKTTRDNDKETTSVSDQGLAEFVFNDVYKQVYLSLAGDTNIVVSTCDTSYLYPAYPDSTYPKTLTIRFDTINSCAGADGITRKGTIKAILTGDMGDSLSMATITFNKYYVNGNKVTGTKYITYKGHNSSGHKYYTVKVYGATITTGEGEISWTSNRTREWIEGDTTMTTSDDVYLITGTTSGTSITGNTFAVITNSPLRVELGCKYPTSGIITLQPGGNLVPRKVDFGTGACDAVVAVTIAGKTFDVTLP